MEHAGERERERGSALVQRWKLMIIAKMLQVWRSQAGNLSDHQHKSGTIGKVIQRSLDFYSRTSGHLVQCQSVHM